MTAATLEVWQLVTENDEEVVARYENVLLTYEDGRAKAWHGDDEVATMSTFDDDPVVIHRDSIIIEGIVAPGAGEAGPPYEYGRWVLRQDPCSGSRDG